MKFILNFANVGKTKFGFNPSDQMLASLARAQRVKHEPSCQLGVVVVFLISSSLCDTCEVVIARGR